MRDEIEPRVAPPRRVRCPACGAFTRKIDRRPRPKASQRRARSDAERQTRREQISIKNRMYREQKHNETNDQDSTAGEILPRVSN